MPFIRMLSRSLNNLLHTLVLLVGLLGLLLLLGWLFAGDIGMLWAVLLGVIPLFVSIRVLPHMVLKLYRTRELTAAEAPELFAIVAELAKRAGLTTMPGLYYIPSRLALIFSVGFGKKGAIAVTDGLLRLFRMRELAGVLGHEISHIRNNDTWVMSFADVVSRVTGTLSLFGQILVLINLPLYFLGTRSLPWIPVILLIFAPAISALMQLALSRTREFDADLHAAQLTGDPAGLAAALVKLEEYQKRLLGKQRIPRHRSSEPSLLRTHPRTDERVRRLFQVAQEMPLSHVQMLFPEETRPTLALHLEEQTKKPRHHIGGGWY
jgi:heat shock protein HtpX